MNQSTLPEDTTPELYAAPNPVVSAIGRFATAYASDLTDPSLVGQEVVVVADVCDAGDDPYVHDLTGYIALDVTAADPDLHRILRVGTMVVIGGTVLEHGAPDGPFPFLKPHFLMPWEAAVEAGPIAFASMAAEGAEWRRDPLARALSGALGAYLDGPSA